MRLFIIGLGIVSVGLLTSCSDVKREIGLGRNSPDEFAVVTRAPLSMPPEYGLTPPNNESKIKTGEVEVQEQAKALIFKTDIDVSSDQEASEAENALLQQVGTAEADPNIRLTVDRESGQVDVKDPYLGRRLLGLGGSDLEKGEALDPVEEMQRLKEEPVVDKVVSSENPEEDIQPETIIIE